MIDPRGERQHRQRQGGDQAADECAGKVTAKLRARALSSSRRRIVRIKGPEGAFLVN
jgi:hypothetical protein